MNDNRGPRLLQQLDHVETTPHGWTAECPICRDTLTVELAPTEWHLNCPNCSHHELVDWLQCDTTSQHPASEDTRRLWRAMMLAPTIEVCEALLRGERVPTSALNRKWAKRFGIL